LHLPSQQVANFVGVYTKHEFFVALPNLFS
jgi:hypothetical protein